MIAIDVSMDSSLFTKRGHKLVMRRLIRQSLSRLRDNLPKHFERNANTSPGGGYGYENRTAKYQRRKAYKKGHQKPLVYTGRLQQAIMSNVRITSTATRGRLVTRGYFPLKAQRRKEIETISPEERREMLARMGRDYALYAKHPEYQTVRRKRKG